MNTSKITMNINALKYTQIYNIFIIFAPLFKNIESDLGSSIKIYKSNICKTDSAVGILRSAWSVAAFLLLTMVWVLVPSLSLAQSPYSYTFTSKVWASFGDKTLSDVTWNASGDGGYFGHENDRGQQFGSGNNPCSHLTLKTNGISGTITQITVNTSGASGTNAQFSVSVGGTSFLNGQNTSVSLTNTATSYTFTGSASGEIQLNWTQTSSKALYIKSIEIVYSDTPSNQNCYTWTLVTDNRDLRIGDEIIIAAAEENYALSAQQNHYRAITSITKNGIYLASPSNNVAVFTLASGTAPNTFALQTSDGYLYAASNESNYLETYSINELDHNGSWDISVTSDGIATLIARGTNGNNILQYNHTNNRFSAYRNTQDPVSIYKLQPVHSDTTITSCNPINWYGTTCAESGFYSRVAGTSTNGCDSLQYLFLTLNPTAEVTLSGDTIIAIGDYTTLHADGASSYLWSTGEETQEITVSPSQTTTYSVTGTITNCQSTVASVTVNVVTPVCSPWRRVTDVSNLQLGDRIVIAAPQDTALGMRIFPYSNSRPSAPIHKSTDGTYIFPPQSNIEQITLEQGNQTGEFALRTTQGYYLSSPSADNNYLNITENITDNSSWNLTSGLDYKIQIQLTHSSDPTTQRNCLRYNKNEKYFACYEGIETNFIFDCYIYKYHPYITGDTNATSCGTEYLWHDLHCTSSGDYTRIYTGDSGCGCDSMVTLHLTLLNEVYDTVYLNPGSGACDSAWTIPGRPLPHAYPCNSEYSTTNGFAGWSPVPITDDSTSVPDPLFPKDTLCPTCYDTLYAVYRKCTGSDAYEKVVAPPADGDWSGEYLIANENYDVFDGNRDDSGLPAYGNYVSFFATDLSNGSVPSGGSNNADLYKFIITGSTNNWQIQSASGYYIWGENWLLNASANPPSYATASISLNSDESVNIIYNNDDIDYHLRFYGNTFFFYSLYELGGTGPIYLYKKSTGPCLYSTYPNINIPDLMVTPSIAICEGDSTTLKVSAPRPTHYQWCNGSVADSIIVTASGTYTVTGTDDFTHCVGSDSVTVTVDDIDTVYFDPGTGTCIHDSLTEQTCLAGITLPDALSCSSEYEQHAIGWTTHPIDSISSVIPSPLYYVDSIYFPTTNDTLYAVYQKCTGSDAYERVTAPPADGDWSGEYLIANENYDVFDGNRDDSGLPAYGNFVSFFATDLSNGSVPSGGSNNADLYKFIITGNTNNWQIQSASGYYIWGENWVLTASANPPSYATASISLNSDESVNIICNNDDIDYHLRFYSNTFFFYSSDELGGTGPIYLYKKSTGPCLYSTYPNIDIPDLTVTPSIAICEGDSTTLKVSTPRPTHYQWSNGSAADSIIVTTNGTYTVTGTDDVTHCVGSDSVVVTVKDTTMVHIYAEVCLNEPYSENGFNVTAAETGTPSLIEGTNPGTGVNGCDSTTVLHLTINPLPTFADDTTLCENELPYNFHGHVFTADGTLTDTEPSLVTGCDSTWTLTVHVNPLPTFADDTTLCANELPYIFHGHVFSAEGTLTDTEPSLVTGCDSTWTLTVHVNPLLTFADDTTLCANEAPIHLPRAPIRPSRNTVRDSAQPRHRLRLHLDPHRPCQPHRLRPLRRNHLRRRNVQRIRLLLRSALFDHTICPL